MDQGILRTREAKCTQENPPKCTAKCPIHVDVKELIKAINSNNQKEALKVYSKAAPFPELVAKLCEAPCYKDCVRETIDESVKIKLLEEFVIAKTKDEPKKKVLLPPEKSKSIAVIGSEVACLTVAKLLRIKGYKVDIFTRHHTLGGRYLLDNESIFSKIEDELSDLGVKINIQEYIADFFDEVQSKFDAIYVEDPVGIKFWEQTLGTEINPLTLETSIKGVFSSGILGNIYREYPFIDSICDAKRAVNSIDRYLQGVSLTGNRTGEGSNETQLYTNINDVKPSIAIKPINSMLGYSDEEACAEAERCIMCECLECVKACVFLQHYKGYPKRYFREIYNNLSIVMGIHFANKMINTCSLCGQCKVICPNNADMKDVCLEARQMMVNKGKMPPSAHDFALRDMMFSTSEKFAMYKNPPKHDKASVVFFPGCQLPGSSPNHVESIYKWLQLNYNEQVGLMLNCCGAPAIWSGRTDLVNEQMQLIRKTWLEQEKPKFILACPSCYAVFRDYLPEIEFELIYTTFRRFKLPETKKINEADLTVAVHDSCSVRLEKSIHEDVRHLLKEKGISYVELKYSKEKTACCGYGGLMMFADRDLASKAIKNRIEESDKPYLAYCAMCRDNFVNHGKETYHLLDLLIDSNEKRMKSPDFSDRHDNRAFLKQKLLKEIWKENFEREVSMPLFIDEDVRLIMQKRNILVEDIQKVLTHVEETGRKMWHKDKKCYIAYYQPVVVTYWVEFLEENEGYRILNTYSHRLSIET